MFQLILVIDKQNVRGLTKAPHKGLSGYQALLKSYVSECLRRDEAVYLFDANARFAEALKKHGVSPELIGCSARILP